MAHLTSADLRSKKHPIFKECEVMVEDLRKDFSDKLSNRFPIHIGCFNTQRNASHINYFAEFNRRKLEIIYLNPSDLTINLYNIYQMYRKLKFFTVTEELMRQTVLVITAHQFYHMYMHNKDNYPDMVKYNMEDEDTLSSQVEMESICFVWTETFFDNKGMSDTKKIAELLHLVLLKEANAATGEEFNVRYNRVIAEVKLINNKYLGETVQ